MAETVMVVEDDALIREMVVQVLAGEGFTAVAASNGAEALQYLRRTYVHPALILLDLMMPVMDGWQFRAEQLKDPALAGIPVVVMSATPDDELPAAARVQKPFGIETLLDTVWRLASSGSALHRA